MLTASDLFDGDSESDMILSMIETLGVPIGSAADLKASARLAESEKRGYVRARLPS